ncbi:hypothetical protein MNBD_CPR01-391 [hydrothermal vent metagenome]|uniref:COG1872 n=1 Tax=hydrothermal vent metagenome TaxID=652676 RepID=A0A3B0UZZ7_9ZZZZ
MYIKVVVTPSARKEKIEEKKDGALIISVREPASGNNANKRVREIIAFREGVSVAQVRILTGHHSRAKMISVLNR